MYSENVTSVDIVAVHTHYGTFILNYVYVVTLCACVHFDVGARWLRRWLVFFAGGGFKPPRS